MLLQFVFGMHSDYMQHEAAMGGYSKTEPLKISMLGLRDRFYVRNSTAINFNHNMLGLRDRFYVRNSIVFTCVVVMSPI